MAVRRAGRTPRKVFDIHAATNPPIAREALERIGALYKIEANIRGPSVEQRQSVRQAQTLMLLDDLHTCLHATAHKLSRRSALAGSTGYSLSPWD